MTKVRILGAGVMGLVMATELVARGHDVDIVDPKSGPGPHSCSWWAGGMLAPWCEGASAEEAVERLGVLSIDWWENHTECVVNKGTLVVTAGRDRGELERFARRSRHHQVLDEAQISSLEPDLTRRFQSALFFEQEAHLSPRDTLSCLQRELDNKGIGFTKEEPQTPVDIVVDARGLMARDRLSDLRGVRGEMIILRCPEVQLTRPIRLLHPRFPLYIVPRGDGVYMLGATMIESDSRGPVTARSLFELLSAAWTIHPAFGEAEVLEMGADTRPAFPDNLPKLRRDGSRIFANGLYRHGFLLSPAVARMTADHIEQGIVPEFMDVCEW